MDSGKTFLHTVEDTLFKALRSPGRLRMLLIKIIFPEIIPVAKEMDSWKWETKDYPPKKWEVELGRRVTTRCNSCGAPTLERCPWCGSTDIEHPGLDANRYCNKCHKPVNVFGFG